MVLPLLLFSLPTFPLLLLQPLSSPSSTHINTNTVIDSILARVIDLLPSSSKYTIIYTTTPSNATPQRHGHGAVEPDDYEMEAVLHGHGHGHGELKRDLKGGRKQKRQEGEGGKGNETLPEGPLFERYQFLSPGTSC